MKRILSILVICVMLMGSFPSATFANFITDFSGVFQNSEEFSGRWKNVNEVGILEPDNIVFEVTAKVQAQKPVTYMAYISIDDAEPLLFGVMKLKPGKEEVKSFKPDIDNGNHSVEITITDGEETVFTFKDDITVMAGYEKQFMDEFEEGGTNYTGNRVELQKKLLDYAGYTGLRKDTYWSYTEPSKGVFDWTYINQWGSDLPENYSNWNAILDYGNGSVYPMWQSHLEGALPKNADVRIAPHTQEGIRAYANFGIEVLKHYPQITSLEIWNEPNLNAFWTSDPATKQAAGNHTGINYEYIDMLKATGATIRSEFPDRRVITGLSHAYEGFYEMFEGYIDAGIYPYVDNVSYHFYAVNSGIDDGRFYEKRLDTIENAVIGYGGWKPLYLTECGWHTGTAVTARDDDYIAEELPKLFTVCDAKGQIFYAFSFNDRGTNPADKESTWGMIYQDGTPKAHYVSVSERNKQLNGGLYVGELDLGDSEIRAFVYLKQGKPVVMIWDGSKERDAHTITFEDEQFEVKDHNGNLVSSKTDTITLTSAPAYINGLSHKYIAMAAKADVKYDRSLYAETYKEMLPQDILAEADAAFENAENALDNATEENIKASIEEFNKVGLDIIAKFAEGEIADVVASRATYELSKTIETLSVAYMSEYDGEVLNKPLYSAAEAKKKAEELYRNDNRVMQYSDAILTYATKTEEKAEKLCGLDYAPEDTKGYIAGWGLLTKVYSEWFDAFSDSEAIMDFAMVAQVLPESRSAYVNENIAIKVNANNYSNVPFEGTLRLYDEEDNEIAVSENFKMDKDGHKYVELPFTTIKYKEEKDRNLTLSFVDKDGNRLTNEAFALTLNDTISAFVQPCTTTIDKMDSVDLRFTNLTDRELAFTLNVESDENYSFVSNKQKITMSPNEERVIELPITAIKETKFHHYTMKYEAVSEDGIVIAGGTTPLNFTAIVKQAEAINPQEFTGDMSDWYDAYPIYINSPENPDDETAWDKAELSARAFLKWDEENLYVLIDAYDDVHYNYMTGSGIWDGDSVQISVDPKNTKSVSKYDSDDYEFGMAIGGAGIELWAWQTPIKSSTGAVDFINIIRDDENKVTRYIAAFPKSELSGLDLKDGNSFGMNIAINDADVLNRDAFYQLTKGTADTKNPSLYADFTLTTGGTDSYIDGRAELLFPNVVANTN